MIEGMAESLGMVTGFVGAIIVAYRDDINAILARYRRKEARHRPVVAAATEYRGRHRFDETQPWESRVFDEDKNEVGRVRSEGKEARRAGSPHPEPGMRPGTPGRAEPRAGSTPGRSRPPAGQARQRFARASARSEKLMALR